MYKADAVPFEYAVPGSSEVRSSSLTSVVTQLHLASSNMSVDSVADELVRRLYDTGSLSLLLYCGGSKGCRTVLHQGNQLDGEGDHVSWCMHFPRTCWPVLPWRNGCLLTSTMGILPSSAVHTRIVEVAAYCYQY